MKSTTSIISVLSALFLTISCQKEETTQQISVQTGGLDVVFLDTPPADAVQVSSLFEDPTPGRQVVVSGEVMGKMNNFVTGRSLFTLGDPTKLTPCHRKPGDQCETPWDVCCDDPDVVSKSIATIQVLDEHGRHFKEGLKGKKGLKELSFVTINGTIAKGSNKDNLLITASGIHVAAESPYENAKPVNLRE